MGEPHLDDWCAWIDCTLLCLYLSVEFRAFWFLILNLFLSVRKNLILADCMCEQQICSSDYTPPSVVPMGDDGSPKPAVYQMATRHLQQAMVPGEHLVSVHLCDRSVYDAAILAASQSRATET
jgi:hypothetical protein